MRKTALTNRDSLVLPTSQYAEWHFCKDYTFIIGAQNICLKQDLKNKSNEQSIVFEAISSSAIVMGFVSYNFLETHAFCLSFYIYVDILQNKTCLQQQMFRHLRMKPRTDLWRQIGLLYSTCQTITKRRILQRNILEQSNTAHHYKLKKWQWLIFQ
jgi:hypothetical protein